MWYAWLDLSTSISLCVLMVEWYGYGWEWVRLTKVLGKTAESWDVWNVKVGMLRGEEKYLCKGSQQDRAGLLFTSMVSSATTLPYRWRPSRAGARG